ncbi:amino acid ABC transporter permease [Pelagibacterales bacterium]|nr:amino acid ABC transporter permease [Pelagibacterales bacterium]
MRIIAILSTFVVFSGCAGNYNWGWYAISPFNQLGSTNISFLISGLGFTVSVSIISIFFATLLGLLISIIGLSKLKFVRYINISYIEIIRSVPVLVMILWIYYGLPVLVGINFTAFTAGIIALSICDSPFLAEIFRSGFEAVPKGQNEAGTSLGMRFYQRFRLIILPQAIKIILPALGNQFVYMLKMSSLVSIIGLNELTRKANELVVSQYRPLEIYTFLVLEYLVLILVISYLVRRMEKKLTN